MTLELDLFPNAAAEAKAAALAHHKHLWQICWDWTPRVGEPASFHCCCATDVHGRQHYTSMARCVIRELTDTDCLIEYIEVLPGDPCGRHGKLFRLPLTDLWPDCDHERQKQNETHPD